MKAEPLANIDAASARLEQALARLEAAMAQVSERAGRAVTLETERSQLGDELRTMRADHAAMSKRLGAVETEYRELEKIIDNVAARLDSTIGQLKALADG